MSGTLFKEDSNGRIRYNHLQLLKTHKALKSLQKQQIRKAKETDLDYKDYKGRETQLEVTYIPNKIAEKFVIKFHKGTTQGHNGIIVLIARLG